MHIQEYMAEHIGIGETASFFTFPIIEIVDAPLASKLLTLQEASRLEITYTCVFLLYVDVLKLECKLEAYFYTICFSSALGRQ